MRTKRMKRLSLLMLVCLLGVMKGFAGSSLSEPFNVGGITYQVYSYWESNPWVVNSRRKGPNKGVTEPGGGSYSYKSARVVGAVDYLSVLDIPETVPYEGKDIQITTIDANAFKNRINLYQINMPFVTTIGESAFEGCSGFQHATVNPNVNIGKRSFANCSTLETVEQYEEAGSRGTNRILVFTSGNEIGDSAFAGCTKMTTQFIPQKVSRFGKRAFENCKGLKTVIVPPSDNYETYYSSSITMGNEVFKGCSNIEDVYTQYMGTIPDDAFDQYVYQHAILHVPAGQRSKYQNLGGWKNFVHIDDGSEEEPQELQDGDTFTAKTVEGVDMEFYVSDAANKKCWVGGGDLTKQAVDVSTSGTITIPSSVNGYDVIGINRWAFYKCDKLTGMVVPEGIGSILYGAYYDCYSLKQIELPNSLTLIDSHAFWDCSALTSIAIPSGVTAISSYTFYCCSSLSDVSLPTTVKGIGKNVFERCVSLKSISIPNGVTTISDFAFSQCSSLSDVSLPTTVIELGKYAFDRCESLKSISIPNSVTSIGERAFQGCSALTSIVIPSAVTAISDYTFRGCTSLSDVSLPTTIKTIGVGAFAQCESLMSISIPSSVTSIGDGAFYTCSALTSITIPRGVTAISDYTFQGCTSLSDVSLPTSLAVIGSNAFRGCTNLRNIVIPEGVMTIGRLSFGNCSSLQTVSLPSTLIEVGAGAFTMTGLQAVSLPSGLETIGDQAFAGCPNLTALSIPSSVRTLGTIIVGKSNKMKSLTVQSGNPYFRSASNAIIDRSTNMLVQACPATVIPTDIVGIAELGFAYVDAMEEVVIPENIKTIGVGAFEDCTDLKRVTIPASIETISDEAFLECTSLEQVTMLSPTPVAIVDNVFHTKETWNEDQTELVTSDFTTATLYVPYGSKAAYQQAAGWKNFQNIVEMEAEEPKLVLTNLEVEGDGIVGTTHKITISVRNDGADFNGRLYLIYTSGLDMYLFDEDFDLSIPSNTEKTLHHDFVFDKASTWYFYVNDTYDSQGSFGTTTWVVTPAATLTAKNYTREYGEENPDFGFTADKGGFSGTPKITCTADRYSDVGTYDIVIEQGSVDNNYVTYVMGTLTITPATLTVKAQDWLSRQGLEPSGIMPKYENFKNGEDKSVLTREPQFTTTATASSPMGSVHQLTFSGAEAKNYLFNYIPGTITIIGRPGDVNRDSYVNTTDAVDVIQATLGYNSLQDIFDGDLYRDNEITLADVASVIDYIMADDRVAARRSAPITETNSLLSLTLDEQGRLAVMLQNDMPFIGVQFDVTLPGDADLSQMLLSDHRRNGHSVAMRHMDDGSYRVLVYSMQNTALRGSDGMLATLLTSAIDGDVALSNIHVVDEQCADHRLPDVSLSMLTGISTLTEDTAPFDIYDLNGRLVRRNATSTKGLHRGVYMINSQKVIIK